MEILAALPARALAVEVTSGAGGRLEIEASVEGIDRLDVHLDDRPRLSLDVQGQAVTAALEAGPGPHRLELRGFAEGALVARRLVEVGAGP
ncbi:MAG: hypothetical protein U0359_27955 [Byssovorax sp.]